MSTGGQSNTSPTCYILSDQQLPRHHQGGGRLATLSNLVTTFMRLTRGYDLGIGSFLLISSLNHLGRVGAAAYAEDLVSAFHNIETTFGGQIRALHGYPVCADTVSNQLTIRALMEIEAWLAFKRPEEAALPRENQRVFHRELPEQQGGQQKRPCNRRDTPEATGLTLQQRENVPCWHGLAKTSQLPPAFPPDGEK